MARGPLNVEFFLICQECLVKFMAQRLLKAHEYLQIIFIQFCINWKTDFAKGIFGGSWNNFSSPFFIPLILVLNYNSMSCIFTKSKYYQQAKLSPLDLCPPIGYDLFTNKIKKNFEIPNDGQLIIKEVFDKPHHKILSSRKTPLERVQQYLKVSEVPRKNQYLSNTLVQFMRNQINKQLFLTISSKFIPNRKPECTLIELTQLLKNPRIQSISHIEDYSLSKYFYLCIGSDPFRMNFLYEFFNRRLIEYPVQCQIVNHFGYAQNELILEPGKNTIFEPPEHIQNVQQVLDLIQQITKKNKTKDPLYSGVHFLFADFSPKNDGADYFERQIKHYPTLQYFIVLLTGILGDGQTAVLKLCGTFKHKTLEFLFLLKLIFNGKVSLCKTLGSNPFLPDSYVVCEYYNKANGQIIHRYLVDNYHLLREYGDEKLLLESKKILKQDMHGNVRSFNDGIIVKSFEINLKQFRQNSNIQYYPPKEKIIERLPKYAPKLEDFIRQSLKSSSRSSEGNVKREEMKKQEKIVQLNKPSSSANISGLFKKKHKDK